MTVSFPCQVCSGTGIIYSPMSEKPRYCGCCGGLTTTSLERHLQFQLGANVLMLDGRQEASVGLMNWRLLNLIKTECQQLGYSPPVLEPCPFADYSPQQVLTYWTNQLQAEDCLHLEGTKKSYVNADLFAHLPPL